MKKSRRGSTARQFGFTWEREVVKDFKRAGWSQASTSRYSSREYDNVLNQDIFNVMPFAVQCKASNSRFPAPTSVLSTIVAQNTDYKVLAVKMRNKGKYAVLEWNDFIELISKLKKENIL